MNKIVFLGGNLYPYQIGGYEVFNYYLFKSIKEKYGVVSIINEFPKPSYCSVGEYSRPFLSEIRILNSFSYFLHLLLLYNKKKTVFVLSYSKSRWLHWWPYPLLNKICNLQYLIIVHGGGLTKWDCPFIHNKLFLRAKEIIGVSNAICDEYKKRSGRQLIHLPPVIPFQHFEGDSLLIRQKYGILTNDFVFLIVGSIKQLKNPQAPILAASILGCEYLKKYHIKFIYAGDGVLRSEMERLINVNSLENYVKMIGVVPREDIPSIYSMANAYIISSDYEGTPISMLEAMYNSLIIIGSNVRGINSIITENFNGYLFERNDYKQLSDCIASVINLDSTIRQKFIRESLEYIANDFNYNKMLDRLIEVINS